MKTKACSIPLNRQKISWNYFYVIFLQAQAQRVLQGAVFLPVCAILEGYCSVNGSLSCSHYLLDLVVCLTRFSYPLSGKQQIDQGVRWSKTKIKRAGQFLIAKESADPLSRIYALACFSSVYSDKEGQLSPDRE